jgi:hypothetical protein
MRGIGDRKRVIISIGVLVACSPQQATPAHDSATFVDPGWSYSADQGTPVDVDCRRYDVRDPVHGSLRVYATDFTTDLSVEIDISGFTSPSAQNAIVSLNVIDGLGRALPRRGSRTTNSCQLGGRPRSKFLGERRRSWFPMETNVCTITDDFNLLDFGASKDRLTIVVRWTDGSAHESRIDMTAH